MGRPFFTMNLRELFTPRDADAEVEMDRLQEDVTRLQRERDQLIQLKPEFSGRYWDQYWVALQQVSNLARNLT